MLNIPPSLCLECRAAKHLCGLAYCPIMVKLDIVRIDINNSIDGLTPPSVFVGRNGYPKVSVGPLVPPIYSDTSLYDTPELWSNLSLEEILRFRLSLIRGSMNYSVDAVKEPDNYLLKLQELAISKEPVESEMVIDKVKNRPTLSEYIPPFGPSGRLLSFNCGNVKVDKRIEKRWYDLDLNAKDCIIMLYNDNVNVSTIIKAFSMGMLGTKKRRRLVPTRWSITAVDDVISRYLINRIKNYEVIDKYYVYIRKVHMNTFVAIIIPGIWRFEWIESWFPKTTWNMLEYGEPEIVSDYEPYKGLDHYAKVGGCYYSARLATSEHLNKLKIQGSVLMIREIYPGFNLPIGVWFVREQVRAMFRSNPITFDNLESALMYTFANLKVPFYKYREKSKILASIKQKSIEDYL